MLADQVFVVATLDDLAVVQYNDGIAVADGGQSVGNNEYGSALHQIVHSFLYDTLCTGIDT